MALRVAGLRAISHALSGKYSGAACLLNFRQGNVSGKRFNRGEAIPMGKLPTVWRDRLIDDKENHALYVVFSYDTPIAWCTMPHPTLDTDQCHIWVVPPVKYSRTTTNHQNVVFVEIKKPGFYRYTNW